MDAYNQKDTHQNRHEHLDIHNDKYIHKYDTAQECMHVYMSAHMHAHTHYTHTHTNTHTHHHHTQRDTLQIYVTCTAQHVFAKHVFRTRHT